jgi:hypothetical protein
MEVCGLLWGTVAALADEEVMNPMGFDAGSSCLSPRVIAKLVVLADAIEAAMLMTMNLPPCTGRGCAAGGDSERLVGEEKFDTHLHNGEASSKCDISYEQRFYFLAKLSSKLSEIRLKLSEAIKETTKRRSKSNKGNRKTNGKNRPQQGASSDKGQEADMNHQREISSCSPSAETAALSAAQQIVDGCGPDRLFARSKASPYHVHYELCFARRLLFVLTYDADQCEADSHTFSLSQNGAANRSSIINFDLECDRVFKSQQFIKSESQEGALLTLALSVSLRATERILACRASVSALLAPQLSSALNGRVATSESRIKFLSALWGHKGVGGILNPLAWTEQLSQLESSGHEMFALLFKQLMKTRDISSGNDCHDSRDPQLPPPLPFKWGTRNLLLRGLLGGVRMKVAAYGATAYAPPSTLNLPAELQDSQALFESQSMLHPGNSVSSSHSSEAFSQQRERRPGEIIVQMPPVETCLANLIGWALKVAHRTGADQVQVAVSSSNDKDISEILTTGAVVMSDAAKLRPTASFGPLETPGKHTHTQSTGVIDSSGANGEPMKLADFIRKLCKMLVKDAKGEIRDHRPSAQSQAWNNDSPLYIAFISELIAAVDSVVGLATGVIQPAPTQQRNEGSVICSRVKITKTILEQLKTNLKQIVAPAFSVNLVHMVVLQGAITPHDRLSACMTVANYCEEVIRDSKLLLDDEERSIDNKTMRNEAKVAKYKAHTIVSLATLPMATTALVSILERTTMEADFFLKLHESGRAQSRSRRYLIRQLELDDGDILSDDELDQGAPGMLVVVPLLLRVLKVAAVLIGGSQVWKDGAPPNNDEIPICESTDVQLKLLGLCTRIYKVLSKLLCQYRTTIGTGDLNPIFIHLMETSVNSLAPRISSLMLNMLKEEEVASDEDFGVSRKRGVNGQKKRIGRQAKVAPELTYQMEQLDANIIKFHAAVPNRYKEQVRKWIKRSTVRDFKLELK